MPHRDFTDPSGVRWQVWDVVPKWADRRTGSERRRTSIDDLADPPALQQRVGRERRSGESPGVRRVKVGSGMTGGWLTFESSGEKRRLSPIPPSWESASDADLARWCASAHAAPKRRLIE